MSHHALTFRGEDYEIPAGSGRCTVCHALLEIEAWLREECPGPQPVDVHAHQGEERA